MKITSITAQVVQVEFNSPFVTAALSRTHQSTIIVKVQTDEGVFGIGESVPTRHVTGETIESALVVLKELEQKLLGQDPLSLEKIHMIMDQHIVGNFGAKAGIDIALYDLQGKVMNKPLYQLLGGYSNTIETDVTLSIDEPKKMAQSALEFVQQGLKILKVKIGVDPIQDIERIKMIREAVGDSIKIKIDANQGYNAAEAITVINSLQKYNVLSVEQPVPYWDIHNMAYIRQNISIKLIADESVHTHHDAMKFIQQDACDMINIKLMKSAGIFKAEKITALCEAAGIPCMLGCMAEGHVASTAGAHFAAAKRNVLDVDLDGSLLNKPQTYLSGGYTRKGGMITLTDKPGLGLELDFDYLNEL